MISKKQIVIWIFLIILPLVVTASIYPYLPNLIPKNTSFNGVVSEVGNKNIIWLFPVLNFIFFFISIIVIVKSKEISLPALRLVRIGKYEKGTITVSGKQNVYKFAVAILFCLDLMIFGILYQAYIFNPETMKSTDINLVLIGVVLLIVVAIRNTIVMGKRTN